MTQFQRRAIRGTAMVAGMVLATALIGCGNFFVCDKASCTGNGTTPTGPAGNVAYVANDVSASTSIDGYTLGKTTLTATTSSPYLINNVPAAMVVSRNNGFLYVASASTTANPYSSIYGFTIGTGGALSRLNGGDPFITLPLTTPVAAMDASPDGQWLIVSTAYDPVNGATIQAYSLNATTGAVGPVTSSSPQGVIYPAPTSSVTTQVSALKVAPSGNFIAVALGTGGLSMFGFNTSTGAITLQTPITFTPAGTAGAYDVAIDSNNLLYVAASGVIFVYPVSSAGVWSNSISNATIGSTGPWSIALDGTSYVYAGATNLAANLIYAFSNKSGTLTALTTTPTISAPTTTTKIAVDSTGAYLLAAGYDSSAGLKLYSITSATGVLTSLDTAPTGTTTITVPTALALSH